MPDHVAGLLQVCLIPEDFVPIRLRDGQHAPPQKVVVVAQDGAVQVPNLQTPRRGTHQRPDLTSTMLLRRPPLTRWCKAHAALAAVVRDR